MSKAAVVAVCRNRRDHLVWFLRSWHEVEQVQDILIVDWGSDAPLDTDPLILELMGSLTKVRIVRVDEERLNIGVAKNLGMSLARGEVLVMADVDVMCVSPQLIGSWIDAAAESPYHAYYRGRDFVSKRPCDHVQGTFVCHRKPLEEIGGYREDFNGYGVEDDAIYNSLRQCGLRMIKDDSHLVLNHLEHPPYNWNRNLTISESIALNRKKSARPQLFPNKSFHIHDEGRLLKASVVGKATTTPLVAASAFETMLGPLSGKKTRRAWCPLSYGNTGDMLIWEATSRLYKLYDIQELPDDRNQEWDFFAFPGGGSMGTLYKHTPPYNGRRWWFDKKKDIPLYIWPQTFNAPEPETVKSATQVYVRDATSLAHAPGAILLPDLAMSLSVEYHSPGTLRDVGLFFREDCEKKSATTPAHYGDPAYVTDNPYEYVELASSCRELHTDRLHFAIAGLLTGRDVTLYPNSYHKNKSVYNAWLKERGCKWSDRYAG